MISVFAKACQHFHQTRLEGLLVIRNGVPCRHPWMAWCELCIFRNPAFRFGILEGTLAIGIPAIVEFAFVPISPFLVHMVRTMQGSGGPIHVEGLVGAQSFMRLQPVDRVVGQVFADVISLLWGAWWHHHRGITHQMRFILGGFTCQEPVEVFKSESGWPVFERTCSSDFSGWCVVPLAPCSCGVAVVA